MKLNSIDPSNVVPVFSFVAREAGEGSRDQKSPRRIIAWAG